MPTGDGPAQTRAIVYGLPKGWVVTYGDIAADVYRTSILTGFIAAQSTPERAGRGKSPLLYPVSWL